MLAFTALHSLLVNEEGKVEEEILDEFAEEN